MITVGYVLGDGQGYTSILEDDSRDVLLVKTANIYERTICEPSGLHRWLTVSFAQVLTWLAHERRIPNCESIEPVQPAGIDSVVLCIAASQGRAATGMADACPQKTQPVVVGQRGEKGDVGSSRSSRSSGPDWPSWPDWPGRPQGGQGRGG